MSLMKVTLQQLSTSANNKTEFHQLTTTVSFNVSMINETLQHLKDTTVLQSDSFAAAISQSHCSEEFKSQ